MPPLNQVAHQVGHDQLNHWSVGEHGNAWNYEPTGVGGTSRIIKTYGMPYLSIMGEIYGATTLSFYTSQDGIHFFFCNVITATIIPVQPPAPAWDAGINYAIGDEVTSGGNRYYCILAHFSTPSREPPNETYWTLVPATYPQQFHIFPQVGAEYIRLRSSANVIVTATIAAKRSA